MQYTPLEQTQWDTVSHFLAPHGIVDDEAMALYFGRQLEMKADNVYIYPGQLELLGAVLKQTTSDLAGLVFQRLYQNYRVSHPYIEQLTHDLAQEHPEHIASWLQASMSHLNITGQILLLRDARKILPHEPIERFTQSKLLATKSDTVLKKFTPAVEDMPYLLQVAHEFESLGSNYQAFGQTITRGVFIARYGKELPREQPMAKKYSAIEAFSLLEQHHVPIEPMELLKLVQLRYKGVTVASDALAYTEHVFSKVSTDREKTAALAVLDFALMSHQHRLQNTMDGQLPYRHAFAHFFTCFDKTPQYQAVADAIKQALIKDMRSVAQPFQSVQSIINEAPQLLPELLDAFQHHKKDIDNKALIQVAFFGCRIQYTQGYEGISDYGTTNAMAKIVQDYIEPSQITGALDHYLGTNLVVYGKNFETTHGLLQKTLQNMSHIQWSTDHVQAIKNTSIVPKLVLLYLCAGALADPKNTNSHQHGLIPNLNWQPLPFLRTIYPEHLDVWNTMQKQILQTSITDNTAYGQIKQPLYNHIHGQLFTTFASIFLPTKPTFEDVSQLCLALDTSPLAYVSMACENLKAMDLTALDGAVFSMD